MEQRNEPTTAEIVAAIRFCDSSWDKFHCNGCPFEHYPCDGMEILAADEIEKLTIKLVEASHDSLTLQSTIEAQNQKIELLERELAEANARADAAVADIESVLTTHHDYETCWACEKQRTEFCDGSECKPKWRGAQERGKGAE